MKVKITKNPEEIAWYHGKVGETFEVDELVKCSYLISGRREYGIFKEHCEIVADTIAPDPTKQRQLALELAGRARYDYTRELIANAEMILKWLNNE